MIYVKNKYVGRIGLLFMLCGIGIFVKVIFFPTPPGLEIAKVALTHPINQASVVEQYAVSAAQAQLGSITEKMVPLKFKLDTGRLISLDYPPIIIPQTPNLNIVLELKINGFTPYSNWSSQGIGPQHFQLTRVGDEVPVWQESRPGSNFTPAVGESQVTTIVTGSKSKPSTSHLSRTNYFIFDLPPNIPTGQYVFQGDMVVAKYGMPLTDVSLILSQNAHSGRYQKNIIMLLGVCLLFGGFFVFYVTVPPERRIKK